MLPEIALAERESALQRSWTSATVRDTWNFIQLVSFLSLHVLACSPRTVLWRGDNCGNTHAAISPQSRDCTGRTLYGRARAHADRQTERSAVVGTALSVGRSTPGYGARPLSRSFAWRCAREGPRRAASARRGS